jgi:hypothetical protein
VRFELQKGIGDRLGSSREASSVVRLGYHGENVGRDLLSYRKVMTVRDKDLNGLNTPFGAGNNHVGDLIEVHHQLSWVSIG